MNLLKEMLQDGLSWKYAITVVLSGVLVAGVIYGTPLRYADFVEPPMHDVDPTVFYNEYIKNKDNYIFIDVRSLSAYNENHAVGSISGPLSTLYDLRHVLPKKGKQIVLICSGERASSVGFIYLQSYGFKNISRIKGGVENWMAQGLPVEGAKIPVSTGT